MGTLENMSLNTSMPTGSRESDSPGDQRLDIGDGALQTGNTFMPDEKNTIDIKKENDDTDLPEDGTSVDRYVCPHPDCNKTFSRQEHLARHKLNHWPKEIFRCPYVFPNTDIRCNKTFVRKDLLGRHAKRHAKEKNRLHKKSIPHPSEEVVPSTNNEARAPVPTLNKIGKAGAVNVNPNTDSSNYNQFFDWLFDKDQQKTFSQHPPSQQHKSGDHDKQSNDNSNLSNVVFSSSSYSASPVNPTTASYSAHSPMGRNVTSLPASIQQSPRMQPEGTYIDSQQNHGVQVPQHLQHQQQIEQLQGQHIKLSFPPIDTRTDAVPPPRQPNFTSLQAPSFREPPIPLQQRQQHIPPVASLPNTPTTNTINVMADNGVYKHSNFFSIDYMTSDPLQNFMQELAASNQQTSGTDKSVLSGSSSCAGVSPPINANEDIDTSTVNKALSSIPTTALSSMSTTRSNTDSNFTTKSDKLPDQVPSVPSQSRKEVFPRAPTKFVDSGKSSVRDNLLVQKSNINELKKQTEPSSHIHKKQKSNKNGSVNRTNLRGVANRQKLLESMRYIPSIFFRDPATKYNISQEKCQELFEFIPELRFIPKEKLKISLKSFWENFQPLYGLLHKPSFNIEKQPPILILTIIMTGASFLGPSYREEISDTICGPLRWVIFSHPDFQPPSRTYIIQSLLLLESYEKTSTNRYLHERSYLHHGTTIQLLRRTPSLGGHPLRDKGKHDRKEEKFDELKDVFLRWVEFESLKRVAFLVFYMDVSHAVVFGYLNLFISFRQVQLELPCPDKIWESYELSFEILQEFGFGTRDDEDNSQTFLQALKTLIKDVLNMMRGDSSTETDSTDHAEDVSKHYYMQSIIGKKIMLGGLLSVMFQCQEENDDPIFTNILTEGPYEHDITWREILSFAINYWLFEIQGDCNKMKNCYMPSYVLDDPELDGSNEDDLKVVRWTRNDADCKIPVYHMAQIALRIFHHDYYIIAGIPWRMNVKVGDWEFQSVYQRVLNFSKDPYTGGVTIVYAFQFLFEMFVREDPETGKLSIDLSYDPNTDPIITRPNTLALTSLLIWVYSFILKGPEVNIWTNHEQELAGPYGSGDDEDKDSELSKNIAVENQEKKRMYNPLESFEEYLLRMYKHLHIDKNQNVRKYQNAMWGKAFEIQNIDHINRLFGFISYIKVLFDNNYWDLGREFGKLFNNCLERSIGKESHVCHDMYDV
ncbi:Sdd4p KNAG_0D02220 [Huiozyma naganishii CBS 8797]|uniref:C2H2-type domain-containing protein n=1 Tax=Huiozyma naganishii (strain ATCC MYA-139 / BCRC 22969 / CBS 8797 / KCTC 17520 / NBRC 10181 / NCYC 3082 / Yp74L-3) TaxID=1071383 RepID=J7RY04_HUIN7|nr:hypothetical protein KNAG_0D02220 [Kazachstania naganishii CBS 8797]CCK69972.1 hypothetical protein KNAG_0D02220 [Kazachstania naganishii CBS 8797]